MFEMQKVDCKINLEGFNNIYYFEFGKDFSHAPERHDFWEMVYVDSGSILAITEGVVHLVRGRSFFTSLWKFTLTFRTTAFQIICW